MTCSAWLALAGCAAAPTEMPTQPQATVPPAASASAPVAPTADAAPFKSAPQAVPQVTQSAPTASETPAVPNEPPAAAPASVAAEKVDAASTTTPKPTPKASASKPKASTPVKPDATTAAQSASAAAKPAGAPTLNLTALEQRLRDTKAIGLFTKLSIKNQVDDLLDAFRAHYKGQTPPMTTLRQRYDLLLMKVLSSVQDGDPPLASDIASSREAIWKFLNDPANLTSV